MEDLGTKLQNERLKRNIELQEISDATHISISVLKDIENNNFSKYTGDEQYIKMYLRKYAQYLGIDSREYVSDYMTLTDGFKQEELSKAVKVEEKKPKKQVTISNPKFAKSKKVYEDQNATNYIRYIIIVVLIIAIIGVAYYVVSMSHSSSTTFENKDNFVATGDVADDSTDDDSSSKSSKDTTEEDEDTDDEEETTDENASDTTITHTAAYTYTVEVPSDSDTFTVKFDFVCATWCSLAVNDATYSGFEQKVYNEANSANDVDADPESVELTFNTNETYKIVLTNGYNVGHKYYFNGVEVETPKSEELQDLCYITFNIVKKG